MGKHIHTHILENKERADYGKELFPRLSAEIKIEESLLYRVVLQDSDEMNCAICRGAIHR